MRLLLFQHLEVFEFLDIFYDRYIHILTAPLLAHTAEEWHEIGKENFNFFFPFEGPYSTGKQQ